MITSPALPGFLRSYGLMRQTERLSTTSVVPTPSSLCRLRRAPAGVRPFPTLSLRSWYRRLGPYPATVPRCFRPFLPAELRPRQRVKQLGPWDAPATQLYAGRNFGAATIRSCSGSATRLAHRLLRRSEIHVPAAAGPYTPGCILAVAGRELRYRYVSESDN